MQFEELREKVVEWANERGLIEGATIEKQAMKLGEEYGEVLGEILKNDRLKLNIEIGDMLVVIINMCEKLGTKPEYCLWLAYTKIKDRKGKMQNGTYVKAPDLKPEPAKFDTWRDADKPESWAKPNCMSYQYENPFGLGK